MKKELVFWLLFVFILGTTTSMRSQDCGTRQLDPRIEAFFKLINYQDLSLDELRALPIERIKFSGPPPQPYPEEDVKRIKVSPDSIPVLVFNPLHSENLPVIINYHGGGFISPLVAGLEHSLWQEAKTYGAVLFAVDYRVAPEHVFPVAVNDSFKAFKWIAEHAGRYGGDTSRIALMGNSAGANLVASITQRARREGIGRKIKLQVLNGMPADLRHSRLESSASYQENATGYFQTKALTYFAIETYAPGQEGNPEVSPILAADFTELPPAVIITAEFDPLRDDGFMYADRLRQAGVPVWQKCFPGQIHCLIGLPPEAEEWKEIEEVVKLAMASSF